MQIRKDCTISTTILHFLRRPGLSAYAAATLIGLWFAGWIFPTLLLFHAAVPDSMFRGDAALYIVGQRAYFADSWHWPLLRTTLLDWPNGVSIAMTDSIPLIALPLKLVSFLLPKDFSAIHKWMAFAYMMQPVSAVFALRSAGERRLIPAIAISVFSIAIPTLLFRWGHIALSSHFLILLAIGVYFRMVNGQRGNRLMAMVLLPASLLVHPYLAFMVFAILFAAPTTLLIRQERRWRQAGLTLLGACAITVALHQVLGYQGLPPTGGFGYASMNALSPVYPTQSYFAGPGFPLLDATGLQAEGYQYLGAGLILLLCVCLISACLSTRTQFLRRHWGLVLCAVAITLLALSNRVFIGAHKVLDLGPVPPFMDQLRASGRLFWVVTYIMLVGAVAAIGRLMPRWAATFILLVLAYVQFADTRTTRFSLRATMHGGAQKTLPLDTARVETLLSHHQHLVLSPLFGCGADWADREFQQLLLAAPRNHITVNTTYVARYPELPDCDATRLADVPVAPDEMRVFLPQTAQTAPFAVPDWQHLCRQFGRLAVCTRQTALLTGLAPLQAPAAMLDHDYRLITGEPTALQGPGWSGAEPGGTWTNAHAAFLIAQLPDLKGADLILSLSGYGFTGPALQPQHVDVWANGHQVAAWDVSGRVDSTMTATIPQADLGGGPLLLRLDIAKPTRPCDVGMGTDWRELGVFVHSFHFAPKNAHT